MKVKVTRIAHALLLKGAHFVLSILSQALTAINAVKQRKTRHNGAGW